MVGENKSSRIFFHDGEGIGQSPQLMFLFESRDRLSYKFLTAMTCDDIRLLLGQVSFISKVFMICPIDCKKFVLSSCSVMQKTWKDNLVQQRPLLWGINWDNTCRSINHQTKNPNRQRQPIMANWNEKIGYKVVVVNTSGWTCTISEGPARIDFNFILACKPELLGCMSTEISNRSLVRWVLLLRRWKQLSDEWIE